MNQGEFAALMAKLTQIPGNASLLADLAQRIDALLDSYNALRDEFTSMSHDFCDADPADEFKSYPTGEEILFRGQKLCMEPKIIPASAAAVAPSQETNKSA